MSDAQALTLGRSPGYCCFVEVADDQNGYGMSTNARSFAIEMRKRRRIAKVPDLFRQPWHCTPTGRAPCPARWNSHTPPFATSGAGLLPALAWQGNDHRPWVLVRPPHSVHTSRNRHINMGSPLRSRGTQSGPRHVITLFREYTSG